MIYLGDAPQAAVEWTQCRPDLGETPAHRLALPPREATTMRAGGRVIVKEQSMLHFTHLLNRSIQDSSPANKSVGWRLGNSLGHISRTSSARGIGDLEHTLRTLPVRQMKLGRIVSDILKRRRE